MLSSDGCQQAVGGETAGVLDADAESGPEATTAADFVVGGAAVVVAAQCAACGDVALSHDQCGDEERVVVVLFVGGEDDAVAHLAACQGRVVAHDGVVEAQSEFEMHVFAQQESFGNDAVFEFAAVAYHAVAEHDALLDEGWVVGTRADCYIVQALGILDGAAVAHSGIASLRGLDCLASDLLQAFNHCRFAAEAGPHVGIANGHTVEWEDFAASVFVHRFEPGMVVVRSCHLVDVE